jgi:hypothetical protein
VNPVGQVDEESRNGKVEWKEDSVVDKDDSSYQGASTLSLNLVKDEVVDVPGISSIKPTTINGIYSQLSSSPPPAPLSTLLVARIQPSTSASYTIPTRRFKQEPIEQPIHTAGTVQPRMMDNTHYV